MSNVKPLRRRSGEARSEGESQRTNDAKTQSQYQPYKEAAWGFINTWYPALFSEELKEGDVEGCAQICGHPDRVAADQRQGLCAERSVHPPWRSACPRSRCACRIRRSAAGITVSRTISNPASSRRLSAIPDDKLIGTTGVTTYPIDGSRRADLRVRPGRRFSGRGRTSSFGRSADPVPGKTARATRTRCGRPRHRAFSDDDVVFPRHPSNGGKRTGASRSRTVSTTRTFSCIRTTRSCRRTTGACRSGSVRRARMRSRSSRTRGGPKGMMQWAVHGTAGNRSWRTQSSTCGSRASIRARIARPSTCRVC